jgi:hypothetical protein
LCSSSQLGAIRCTICTWCLLTFVSVVHNWRWEGRTVLTDCMKLHLCSAKPYDILKIKNAMVPSVQAVMSRSAAFEVLFPVSYLAVTN